MNEEEKQKEIDTVVGEIDNATQYLDACVTGINAFITDPKTSEEVRKKLTVFKSRFQENRTGLQALRPKVVQFQITQETWMEFLTLASDVKGYVEVILTLNKSAKALVGAK